MNRNGTIFSVADAVMIPTKVDIPATNTSPSGLSVIPDPTVTLPAIADAPPIVDVPDTLIFCRNVAFVFVLIFSVAATPVNPEPFPEYDVAVTVPDTFTFCRKVAFVLVLILSVVATPVNAEPSNAGSVPVNCAAGRLVKLAPEPENKFAVEVPATVDVPDTLMFCRNVALVLVLMLSVPAAPTTVTIPTEC